MSQKDRRNPADEGSAGQRALNLLQKLASSLGKPEEFKTACGAWAKHADEAGQSPGFNEVAARIFMAADERGPSRMMGAAGPAKSPIREVGSFSTDGLGRVAEADDGARRLLGVGAGASAMEFMPDPSAASPGALKPLDCLVELRGKSGARFLGHLTEGREGRKSFRVSICAADISPILEAYLRWNLGLTDAETEIVRLFLQRRSTSEIAAERGIRVNTVRTHVNSIIRKLRCRSMTEAVAAVYELSLIPEDHYCDAFEHEDRDRAARGSILKLPGGAQIEYVRHGNASSRPLMVLHSCEYGTDPPKEFVRTAIERGYCLYAPMRPGYGRSTPSNSIRGSADLLTSAIEKLGLKDVALVALSTAAPVGIQMVRASRRIGSLAVVNFLMTGKGKTAFARPKWVHGLLDLAVRSNESYRYTLKVTRSMLRLAGARRFFRSFYAGQEHDLAYIDAHPEEIEGAARLLLTSDAESVRADLIASFIADPDIEAVARLGDKFGVIFGDAAHGVPPELARSVAAEAGVRNFFIKDAGRNCVFQRPGALFDILDTLNGAAASGAARASA